MYTVHYIINICHTYRVIRSTQHCFFPPSIHSYIRTFIDHLQYIHHVTAYSTIFLFLYNIYIYKLSVNEYELHYCWPPKFWTFLVGGNIYKSSYDIIAAIHTILPYVYTFIIKCICIILYMGWYIC